MLNRVQFFETKHWNQGLGGSRMTALYQSRSFICRLPSQAHSVWRWETYSMVSKCFSVETVASFDFGQEDE